VCVGGWVGLRLCVCPRAWKVIICAAPSIQSFWFCSSVTLVLHWCYVPFLRDIKVAI
jgi:hypothetical protein